MDVTIKTIPHEAQRYPTTGDWYSRGSASDVIAISDMQSWESELLVAIHELFEMYLCRRDHIEQKDVDAFDIAFEKLREKGLVEGQPGAQANAPYRRQHELAEKLERYAAHLLGVDWDEHDKRVDKLGTIR